MEYTVIVTLPEQTKVLKAAEGTRLFSLLAENGIQFDAPCGGRCFCGKCRAIIKTADGGLLPGMTDREAAFFTEKEISEGWRLICAVTVSSDLIVTVGAHGAQIQSDTAAVDSISPWIRSEVIELPAPTLSDPRSDLTRLREKLDCDLTLAQIRELPYILRDCDFRVEAVTAGKTLLSLGKPEDNIYGVAVDIGTTTMVAYLIDLRSGKVIDNCGELNPQRVYGGDVISRSDYASQSQENADRMREAVVGMLDSMIKRMAERKNIDCNRIFHVVCVGNTTMMHLFCGITTRNISVSPFIPVVTDAVTVKAGELGFTLENAVVTAVPCVAGYVGADTVACILECNMDKSEKLSLMVDIGTNGEIALGKKGNILCCSTAAGPALEGAHIKHGMGGVTGAISKVDLKDGIRLDVIGGGQPTGICGSGLVDAVSEMLDQGFMDETGCMDEDAMGELACEDGGDTALKLTGDITVTQKDIREVQLAKAAIAAGISTLMKEMNCTYEDIDSLYIAGGFGNYIDRTHAANIGLLPKELHDKMKPVGNAAGLGAQRMLLSSAELQRASVIAASARYVELSARNDFQEFFVDSMYFGDMEY